MPKPLDHVDVNQVSLIGAILKHLCRQHGKNLSMCPRQYNAVVHAANLIVEEMAEAPEMSTPGMGLTRWLASDDTGMSSEWLAGWLSGAFHRRSAYPSDSDDFGRCLRMLEAAPELMAAMPRLREAPKPWPELFAEWESLAGLYQTDRAACSERIRAIVYGEAPQC